MSEDGTRATISAEQTALAEIEEIVRRVVAARVRDRETVDDLVQETLTRLVEARPRLEQAALAPYAVVTARNLVASMARREKRSRRHAPRLIDLRAPDQPDEQALRREESRAVSAALQHLSSQDRTAVIAYEIEGADTAAVAEHFRWSRGNTAVRLSRARARLRVEYLIALRREEPPTERCRPVLVALSSGDKRRQTMLDAGGHLMGCPFCTALSQPLLERRRDLAALVALGFERLWAFLRTGKGQATVAATSAAAIVVAAAAARDGGQTRRPEPRPNTLLSTASGRPIPMERLSRGIGAFVGEPLEGDELPVHAVPSDEGFWAGQAEGDRVWVRLVGAGESGPDVTPGDEVSFRGRLIRHGRGFARRMGVRPQEGASQLRADRYHIVVREQDLEVSPGASA